MFPLNAHFHTMNLRWEDRVGGAYLKAMAVCCLLWVEPSRGALGTNLSTNTLFTDQCIEFALKFPAQI